MRALAGAQKKESAAKLYIAVCQRVVVGWESSLSELPRQRIADPALGSSSNEVRPILDAVSIPLDRNSSPFGNVVANQRDCDTLSPSDKASATPNAATIPKTIKMKR